MVDLCNSGKSLVSVDEKLKHPLNIVISGYSDQIFRFLADKEEDQLSYINRIDQIKDLDKKNKNKERIRISSSSINNNNNNDGNDDDNDDDDDDDENTIQLDKRKIIKRKKKSEK